MLNGTSGWLSATGSESDVVVSSRVRLARNLAQFPFLSQADDQVRQEIELELRNAVSCLTEPAPDSIARDIATKLDFKVLKGFPHQDDEDLAEEQFTFIDVEDLSPTDRLFLMERQLISKELSEASGARGVVVGNKQQTSVMINEEDHVRMQVLRSGFNLDDCWVEANALDDAIESRVAYAFHEQFGYLTACPTNVGTGIRVSVMMHLPALVQTKEIQKVFHAVQKMGLTVRGLYGEGSQAMGDFYQVSNQITLGKSEPEIIEMIQDVLPQLIEYERRARKSLMEYDQGKMHDLVSRAYGILRNAQTISVEETLHLLSSLRMGVNLGLIEQPDLSLANELFMHTQPAHLQKRFGKDLSRAEGDVARAGFLREKLGQLESD